MFFVLHVHNERHIKFEQKLGFFDNSSWFTFVLDQLLLKVLQFNLSLQNFTFRCTFTKMCKTTAIDFNIHIVQYSLNSNA